MAVEYFACMTNHKLAAVDSSGGNGYIVDVYDVVARPFKYGTFSVDRIATHSFSDRDLALQALSWHGVVWFRDDSAEDVVDCASRLFCAEVV